MTRFCAVFRSDRPDSDIQQMGGQLADADGHSALGILADAQPAHAAGPYSIARSNGAAQSSGAAPLIGVGQVTLYNRAALLAELAQVGPPPPITCSDGELLLHFYAYAGVGGFARVNGMFACAIRDGAHLLLLRDAVGARTLFYARAGAAWAAASSLRALRRWPRLPARLNLAAVRSYLTFAYLPGDETLLDGISELLPGYCLRIAADGSSTLGAYWRLQEQPWNEEDGPEVYAGHLRKLIEQSVRDCLPPRQPVAVFLSGGLDSSLVTALAARLHDQPVTTYAINFGAEYTNELAYAHLVASHCGTQHHVLTFNGEQVLSHLGEAMARLDCPVGDPLTVPNLLLARRAAADGFRYTLNGEGGDPCFGGPKNLPMLLYELYRSDPSPAARAHAYMQAYRNCYEDLPALLTAEATAALRTAPPLERLVQPYLEAPSMQFYLNRLMLANVRTKGAHHILSKVEALTSSCGLEAHSPLFHREVVNYSFAIPPRLKLQGTTEKWVLKLAMRDILPSMIVYRPKSGMRIPMQHWLAGPLGRSVREVLLSRRGRARGLFRPELLQAWLRGEGMVWARHANKLWLILTLELWLRSYLDNDQ